MIPDWTSRNENVRDRKFVLTHIRGFLTHDLLCNALPSDGCQGSSVHVWINNASGSSESFSILGITLIELTVGLISYPFLWDSI